MNDSTFASSPAAVGDIVTAYIPYTEGAAVGGKVRPCLVTAIQQSFEGVRLTVAYGTSQTNKGSNHPWEFSIGRVPEVGPVMSDASLTSATDFNLRLCYVIWAHKSRRIGRVHPSIYGRLVRCADEAIRRGISKVDLTSDP